ncbi:hypothetical protein E0493_10120 [Roseomonas sp. M0104]|uniref:Uncharacterized protein n=1 Tax=Teichococcus coralli TaxID=2545983 RepID=A0A845BEK9_9PROT|nr:hypothetical protein [Pseudoroseomonas coralli]MXP63702.1 hypothetical protein [Pseudoroseomonas coralli]
MTNGANLSKLRENLLWSAQRALPGKMPASLHAYSVKVERPQKKLRLRAHFHEPPSEDDIEDLLAVETEIFADFFDDVRVETEIEVIAPGEKPNFLAEGVAYQRPASLGA